MEDRRELIIEAIEEALINWDFDEAERLQVLLNEF